MERKKYLILTLLFVSNLLTFVSGIQFEKDRISYRFGQVFDYSIQHQLNGKEAILCGLGVAYGMKYAQEYAVYPQDKSKTLKCVHDIIE